MASFLKEKYKTEIVPAMTEKMGYTNVMQVPRVKKVVLNMGIGEATQNIKLLDAAQEEMGLIAGQAPLRIKSSKSISNFRLRKGNPIGCSVTLRGERMYFFLERLFNIVIPRIRDFHGLSRNSFDGRGNYSMGLKEHINFPELDYDKVENIRGMDITIVTSAGTDEEAMNLLQMLGMPFAKN